MDFFSNSRRHTRWTGDWSSDVCSSDLAACTPATSAGARINVKPIPQLNVRHISSRGTLPSRWSQSNTGGSRHADERSEERRVGKECGYRETRREERTNGNYVD